MLARILIIIWSALDAGTTYYVRTDGGSIVQCDGRHDAAYAGQGRHRACAWRHPFDALPPGGPPRIAGGDTLVIGGGSYEMGAHAPAARALQKCRQDWPWDCHAATIPSGPDAQRPTRILGAGFDSGCAAAPQLWGSEHASTILDLSGSSNVEIACLELTDRSGCIEFYKAAQNRCERGRPPYGNWASTGITATDSHDVRLADLDIHGLAHDGIRAGRLRDWMLERVRLVGNGWSGWNGDTGDGKSSNIGSMVFRDVEIAWNGCAEKYPGGRHFACWGQNGGGYGDGLGTGETGGDWLFERVDVHHNTQDGIDLLHANANAHIVFHNVHAKANAGNQLKASGSVTVANSTIIGTCSTLAANGLDIADRCRANGNSLSLHLPAHAHAEVRHNRIEGEGDCLIDLGCAADGCAGASVLLSDNDFHGQRRADSAVVARLPCTVWVDPALRGARLESVNNKTVSTRTGVCGEGIAQCRP
jgi:hypothetical protein